MLKKLFTQASLYGISHILTRIINYVLVPLHTAIFITSDYGIITQFYVWAAFLNIIYTFGLETTYFRFASDGSHPQTIFKTLYTFMFIIGGIFSTVLIIFCQEIGGFLGYDHSAIYISIFACILLTDNLVALPFARLRLENKAGKFVILKLSNVIINVSLNYYFLKYAQNLYEYNSTWLSTFYYLDFQIGYVFLSNLIASLFLGFYFLPNLRNIQPFSISKTLIKKCLNYSYPLLLSGIAFTINELIDRLFLEKWLPKNIYPSLSSLDVVGIYGACYKLSIFITVAVQAFKYAAEPFFLKHASDKEAPDLFAKTMKYFVLFCALAFILISINLDWISDIFLQQKSYKQGLIVVPILLLANIFLGIYYNLSIWFKYTNKTYWAAIIGGIGVLITVIINYFMIPLFGYLACAIATLSCYFSMSVLSYYLGKKYFFIPYQVKIIFIYLFVAVMFVYLSNYIFNFYIKNCLFLIICILVFFHTKDKIR